MGFWPGPQPTWRLQNLRHYAGQIQTPNRTTGSETADLELEQFNFLVLNVWLQQKPEQEMFWIRLKLLYSPNQLQYIII